MCIYTVKSVIKYYTRQNSPVYTCFLDASKAFDKISHWTLFKKLIACNTPVLIVRILTFWYQRQSICVKWGKRTSEYFSIINGVRQGGVLSPQLFAIYMDDLSVCLTKCKAGCHTVVAKRIRTFCYFIKKEQMRVKQPNKSRKTVRLKTSKLDLYLKHNMYKWYSSFLTLTSSF